MRNSPVLKLRGQKALVRLHECLPSYRDEIEPLADAVLSRPAQPSFPVTTRVFLCFLPSLI